LQMNMNFTEWAWGLLTEDRGPKRIPTGEERGVIGELSSKCRSQVCMTPKRSLRIRFLEA